MKLVMIQQVAMTKHHKVVMIQQEAMMRQQAMMRQLAMMMKLAMMKVMMTMAKRVRLNLLTLLIQVKWEKGLPATSLLKILLSSTFTA